MNEKDKYKLERYFENAYSNGFNDALLNKGYRHTKQIDMDTILSNVIKDINNTIYRNEKSVVDNMIGIKNNGSKELRPDLSSNSVIFPGNNDNTYKVQRNSMYETNNYVIDFTYVTILDLLEIIKYHNDHNQKDKLLDEYLTKAMMTQRMENDKDE